MRRRTRPRRSTAMRWRRRHPRQHRRRRESSTPPPSCTQRPHGDLVPMAASPPGPCPALSLLAARAHAGGTASPRPSHASPTPATLSTAKPLTRTNTEVRLEYQGRSISVRSDCGGIGPGSSQGWKRLSTASTSKAAPTSCADGALARSHSASRESSLTTSRRCLASHASPRRPRFHSSTLNGPDLPDRRSNGDCPIDGSGP
jgi:hypothetical protein